VSLPAIQQRILVAPLHWGLGHATRCIPIIQYLIDQKHEVILASDGDAKTLLQLEFPQLLCLELPAYQISYRTNFMVINVATQLPRLCRVVKQEQVVIDQIIEKHGIMAIISDNRFGCWSTKVPSFFITHQLQILSNNPIAQYIGNKLMARAMQRFTEIWVPDFSDPNQSLSGKLAHSVVPTKNTRFLGPLSRMEPENSKQIFDFLIILSGPEPQRTKLETILLAQAKHLPYRFALVQGKPQAKTQVTFFGDIAVISHLTGSDLNHHINASGAIICRSGYSSIMDLAVLGKKALLIPTPGQTEQEYLAEYFESKGIFAYQKQGKVDLKAGIASLQNVSGMQSAVSTQFQLEIKEAFSLHGL
jgi:uncharacterized protein (TIGR00661 family)